MKHEDLFNEYQDKLKWIDRRLTPDCLEFYKDTAESWKHAKEVAYEALQKGLAYVCVPCSNDYLNRYFSLSYIQ